MRSRKTERQNVNYEMTLEYNNYYCRYIAIKWLVKELFIKWKRYKNNQEQTTIKAVLSVWVLLNSHISR